MVQLVDDFKTWQLGITHLWIEDCVRALQGEPHEHRLDLHNRLAFDLRFVAWTHSLPCYLIAE